MIKEKRYVNHTVKSYFSEGGVNSSDDAMDRELINERGRADLCGIRQKQVYNARRDEN